MKAGYNVIEIPMERECKTIVADAKRGKNMFALGMLCNIYSFDLQIAAEQIALTFGKKDASVIQANVKLLNAGYEWAEKNLDFKYHIPATRSTEPQIVVNGNTSLALGVLASGMEICAMYPITPATSVSHYLSSVFEKVGGIVHQAEDEIAACAFAIGASYAGKCAVTITSGPGYSLKQEGIGLAVMGEIPLVIINVQRGGPSTGQPTKVEQGDLMTTIFGSHGDAPKVVIAPATIEDCFYSVITARKIAETFNMVVCRAVRCQSRHVAAAVPAAAIQRSVAGAAGRPERNTGRAQALRLESHHRPGAPFHPGSARRHAHIDRTWRMTDSVTSPTTRRATNSVSACAASSSRRCNARSRRRRYSAPTRAISW